MLTEEQSKALRDIKGGKNVLVTGGAGVGKSFLIRKVIEENPLIHVTASTGIAAVNVGGKTIHSFAGIGRGEEDADELYQNVKKYRRIFEKIKYAKSLVIDEISMLDGELFDKIDYVFSKIRGKSAAFGGMQVVLFGDFLQLPPVEKDGEKKQYVFQSAAFNYGKFKIHYLKQIHRQKDEKFSSSLNKIRMGEVTDEVISFFEPRIGVEPAPDKVVINLFSHNWKVDQVNKEKLKSLPGKPMKYMWQAKGDPSALKGLENNCPALEFLELKEGATVLCLANIDVDSGICNGSVGKLVRFEAGQPVVRFNNGVEMIVPRNRWEVKEIKNGKRVTTAYIEQYPLKLGWAISIHKSQGQTLDSARMDLSKCFAPGQVYTALSRVRSIDGLYIDAIDWSGCKADPICVEFYKNLK